MAKWIYTRDVHLGGLFQLWIGKPLPGAHTHDVSLFRGAPTQYNSFSDADPFGDSTAQFTFPAITAFDDFTSPELNSWLGYYANVNLYWVPAVVADPDSGAVANTIDPLTGQLDDISPAQRSSAFRIKIWEGYVASLDFNEDGTLQVSCQGAVFQVDRYLAKPFFPAQPWTLELLVADIFNHTRKPHLRTRPLRLRYPNGWKLKIPKYTGNTVYTPVAKPGTLWSGYSSRQTGSWDHALTGFVQDQLTVMITDDRCGLTQGNQWTISHYRRAQVIPSGRDRYNRAVPAGPSTGRQPVLEVRDRNRTPDFSLQLGLPGVAVALSGDSTQSENVVFGEGTSVDGTAWRNLVVDTNRTDYQPLAYSRDVYPLTDNPQYDPNAFVSEAYTRFGTGFDVSQAASVAQQSIARDRDPGWTGTITLSVDPSPTLSRWQIHAGWTVLLKGFAGSGEKGIPFHIASTVKNPMQGTVTLTVDTRYRDLLTVEEARARTRDPLTPVKMLQVNRTSVAIEDIQAPWDYRAGSGFIPRESLHFHDYRPKTQGFPYADWARRHPPLHYPSWYAKVHANATDSNHAGNWSQAIPILTSEKDTVIRTEVFCVDLYGRPVKVPFHLSLYYVDVTYRAMPVHNGVYSPYINNAFESINPATGQANDQLLVADPSMIIGWGNRSNGVFNRAGFSPGRESDGDAPTGLLVDESTWSFDNTNNPNYDRQAKPGQRQTRSSVTIWAMFYCEYTEPVYFQGRLFRQNPGT